MNWISVKDRLPDRQDEYLILQEGQFYLSIFSDGEWRSSCYCFSCISNKFSPSHWMPLPEPPFIQEALLLKEKSECVSDEMILNELERVFVRLREIKKYVCEQKEFICEKYPNEIHGHQVLHYLHKILLGFVKETDEVD